MKKNKINPCISKELYDKIMKDPGLCAKIIKEDRKISKKVHKTVMRFLEKEITPKKHPELFVKNEKNEIRSHPK